MAYTKAREALRIAKDRYRMTYTEIAKLCGVNLGTVKRWMLSGRADEKAISPLIEKVGVGRVLLSAEQVADHLEQLYDAGPRKNSKGTKVRRLLITNQQLVRIAGRQNLRSAFENDVRDEMRDRGFLFAKGIDDYILVNWKWLHNSSALLDDGEIPEFYDDLADEIDDDEED